MDLIPPITRLVMTGACYVDTILTVPHFPLEDHKLRATSLHRRRGGNVANTLEVLSQLPLNIELILLCVLPSQTSPGTQLIKESLGPSVRTDLCVYREGYEEPASSYIISSEETGSRTIVNYNELPEMMVEEFKERVERLDDGGRTWFHFEGRETATSLACIQHLRKTLPDCLISVEVEKPNRPGLEAMAEMADVVFFSKTWAQAKGFESAEDLLRVQMEELKQASLLCCTWGAEGAMIAGPKEGFLVQDRGPVVERVVDTVGAGDTWTAGVLYMLLSWDGREGLEECAKKALTFANNSAGQKVAQQGFGGLGRLAET